MAVGVIEWEVCIAARGVCVCVGVWVYGSGCCVCVCTIIHTYCIPRNS